MFYKLISTAPIAAIISLNLSGCSFNADKTPEMADPEPVKIVAKNNSLLQITGDQSQTIYQASTDIESITGAGHWLLWSEDDNKHLQLAVLNEDKITPHHLSELTHDMDLLCLAPSSDKVHDLFVHDGDGFFYHYWLTPEQHQLRLVRRIATNPDIENCAFKDGKLLFSDPFIGPLALAIDPETDSILHNAATYQDVLAQSANHNLFNLTATPTATITAQLPPASVKPVMETQPVKNAGDAADDPAIMVTDKTTWIAGTNKQRGLGIYDLSGKELHFLNRGRLNNVDALKLEDNHFLLAASNRTEKTIDLFMAEPDNNNITFISSIPLSLSDPYGLCMGSVNDEIQIFVGDSEGLVEQWLIAEDYRSGKRLNHYPFSSQTEGCVFDRLSSQLYIGQEDLGIWQIDIHSGSKTLIEQINTGASTALVADVEGLDIYYTANDSFLIASSQGDNSYIIYQLNPWKPLGKFNITADTQRGIDGASETDGLAVSSQASAGYPAGIMVVQDGRNRAPEDKQNFKMLDWRHVQPLIKQWQQER